MQGPPVLGVARHDLAFLVFHVQRERRTWRVEPQYEAAYESSNATFLTMAGRHGSFPGGVALDVPGPHGYVLHPGRATRPLNHT